MTVETYDSIRPGQVWLDTDGNRIQAQADTSVAGYVWLSVRFDGGMPVLDWHDEWRIEDHD
ncbi:MULTISPECIES: hypothetical protein [unclassified Blastococcus]